MSKRRLVVNVDHVATVRQARQGREPDPVAAAARSTSDATVASRRLGRPSRASVMRRTG